MALISLSLLKTFLSITGSDQDVLLQMYVDAADTFVKRYCGRHFEKEAIEDEWHDGPGRPALVLNQYPIISVENVYEDEEEVEQAELMTDDGWYLIQPTAGLLHHTVSWSSGAGLIKVSYTAGYEAADIPSDLKLACLATANFFKNLATKSGIRHEALGSYSYTLANDLGSMGGSLTIPDAMIISILDRYRNRYISRLA